LIIKEIHKVGKYEMRNKFNTLIPTPTAISNPDSSGEKSPPVLVKGISPRPLKRTRRNDMKRLKRTRRNDRSKLKRARRNDNLVSKNLFVEIVSDFEIRASNFNQCVLPKVLTGSIHSSVAEPSTFWLLTSILNCPGIFRTSNVSNSRITK